MEPGASSNEDAFVEPVSTVIAVRRAGVGIVAVVAVCANWRLIYGTNSNADRPYTDADADLCL
jgi:hypothetical protein